MNQTLDLPICGLEDSLPDQLFLLHHPASAKYGCYCHDGIHGLAAFSTEVGAVRFAEYIDLSGMSIEEMTFDEAREVAKQRPLPVVSLMLLDRMDDPKIHFVR
jgi:hypothetical protein